MAFQENFEALLVDFRGSEFPQTLHISKLQFGADGHELGIVEGSALGKGSELFFRMEIARAPDRKLPLLCDQALMDRAEEYYSEHWNDEPGTGKHVVIDLLRKCFELKGVIYVTTSTW